MMRYGFTNDGWCKCAISTELWEVCSYKEPLTLVESVRRPWNGFTGDLRQLIGSRRPLASAMLSRKLYVGPFTILRYGEIHYPRTRHYLLKKLWIFVQLVQVFNRTSNKFTRSSLSESRIRNGHSLGNWGASARQASWQLSSVRGRGNSRPLL